MSEEQRAYEEAMYEQQKAWEDEQEHLASASAEAEAMAKESYFNYEEGGLVAEGLLPCMDCKDYRKCPYSVGKQWYIYREIRWCPYQVIYIIEHSDTLLEGAWPDNPDGSGYTDPMIKQGYRSEAYFTKPEEIIGEVEYRLKTTGDAGDALVDEILDGTLAIDRLSRPARLALMYVKGRNRKSKTFPQWRADKKYTQKQR